jgi:outer membrane lipoprotein LolB
MQQASNAIAMCAVACACVLSACAQAPRPAQLPPVAEDAPVAARGQPTARALEQAITLQGQLGIKLGAWGDEPPRGVSFGFFFQGTPQAGELSLMTPLGSQVAQVSWRPAAATLQRIGPGGGELVQRDSIDDLAAEALGEAVPLRTLIHWMQGRPAPDLPHAALPDAAGFQQSGWSVDTRELAQGRIVAHRQGLPGLRDARIVVRLDP